MIFIDYTSNTVKYHESVGRIGTSATGTSANTPSRRVIFHGIHSNYIYHVRMRKYLSLPKRKNLT